MPVVGQEGCEEVSAPYSMRDGIGTPFLRAGMFVMAATLSWFVVQNTFAAPAVLLDEVERIAIVLEGSALEPGCNGVSIIDVDARTVIFRSPPQPGSNNFDLDMSFDNDQIVTTAGFGFNTRLGRWLRQSSGIGDWSSGQRLSAPPGGGPILVNKNGLAFLPDRESILITISGPGFNLGAFLHEEIDPTVSDAKLPPAIKYGNAASGWPTKILVSRDGSVAHLVGEFGRVTSVETSTLAPVSATILHAPIVPDAKLQKDLTARGNYTTTSQIVFADLSVDERFIVTNRWAVPEINVLDVHERRAWTLPVGPDVTMTGGVAFNHGWENHGLLAVNALDKVIIYRFDPAGPLEEVARHAIPPRGGEGPLNDPDPGPGNVAWSARGDHLIVPIDDGSNDFALIEVSDCGRTLRSVAELAVCENDVNIGRGIWTANKRLNPPPDHIPRCPAPALLPTLPPLKPPPPTATPFATPVSSSWIDRRSEEKVTTIEGSPDAASGCGGLAIFTIGQGVPLFRSQSAAEPGRVAVTWGGNSVIIGPSNAAQRSYRVFEDGAGSNQARLDALWQHAEVTPTVGTPLPFGAMSVVWADTQLLLTYRDATTGNITLGLFDRFTVDGPPPTVPLAAVSFPRGVPAEVVLQDYTRQDALQRYGGVGWVVTDLGEVWRLTIRDMIEMTLEGPVASLGAPKPIDGDGGPAARRVHAALSADERTLIVSGWGKGTLSLVELATGAVREVSAGPSIELTGQIAVNRAWEHEGLIAVHAGSWAVVYSLDNESRDLVETSRHAIPPPHGESGHVEPGFIAWGTNGLSLIATIDKGVDEFVTLLVENCGRSMRELYRVASCEDPEVPNRGRQIITNNRFFPPPENFQSRCSPGTIPPTVEAGPTETHREFRVNMPFTMGG